MAENPDNSSPGFGANSASSGTEPSPASSTTPEGARMGVRQGREQKRKKRYLPLELRLRLYDEVLQLRGQGLSYNDIIKRIHRLSGVRLNKSHISEWVRGIYAPLGRVNRFDAKPSPELASVIGVMLSDGSLHLNGRQYHHYGLCLRVKDKEFAEGFGRKLAEVLWRRKPYRARWSPSNRRWVVEGWSHLLYGFLRQPVENLKPYIEHSKNCAAAFLRAFFDGEGSISKRQLIVYNTDKQLLIYIKELLEKHFDIDATGPRISVKKGTVMHSPRTKKAYKTNKDCYRVYIRTHSLSRFHKDIGFTIERKQRRLAEAAKQ